MPSRECAPSRVLIWAVALLTAVLYTLMPLSGDDYSYKAIWHYPDVFQAFLHYSGFVLHHWLYVNGRLANFLAPPLLNLIPQWLFAILCGAATWLMLYISLRWGGLWRRGGFWSTLLIAAVMLAFPWWDSMHLFDCQLNYIWSSALVLTGLWFIMRPSPVAGMHKVGCCFVAFAGGMMHESASIPIIVGGACWLWLHRADRLPRGRKAIAIAFFAGTLLAICSPGIWDRVGNERIPDDTALMLFLKSFAIVGIFWLTLAAMACSRRGRAIIAAAMRTPLLILAIATVPAVVIGLKSGIVGRSGWFGSLYALIVMICLWRRMCPRIHARIIPLAASWILAAAVTAQLSGTIIRQIPRTEDHRRFIEAYYASPDGIVYVDYERDNELPWWTLGRTRGVPDPDDTYLLYTVSLSRGWNEPLPIVLPSDALPAVKAHRGTTRLKSGDIITDSLPAGAEPLDDSLRTYVFRATDGSLWTAQVIPSSGFDMYHLAPLVLDPGDRLHQLSENLQP